MSRYGIKGDFFNFHKQMTVSPTNRGISSIHEPRNKSDNTDKNGDMHLHTKEVIFNMYVAKPTFC